VGYYHFSYPEAEKIIMGLEIVKYEHYSDIFYLTIPSTVTLYELTWGFWGDDKYPKDEIGKHDRVYIDGKLLVSGGGVYFGTLDVAKDEEHVIDVKNCDDNEAGNHFYYGGVAFGIVAIVK